MYYIVEQIFAIAHNNANGVVGVWMKVDCKWSNVAGMDIEEHATTNGAAADKYTPGAKIACIKLNGLVHV